MKKNLAKVAYALIVIISACNSSNNSQTNPGGYVINGTISNKDSGWIYLVHIDSTGIVWDSTRIKESKFTFTGKVAEPLFYHLLAGHGDKKYLEFLIDDTTIHITANKDSMSTAIVSGGRSQSSYEIYKNILHPLIAPLDTRIKPAYDTYLAAVKNGNKALSDSLTKILEPLFKEEQEVKNSNIKSFIHSYPSSIIGAWAITREMLIEPDPRLLDSLFSILTPAVQQSTYGKQVKQASEIAERLTIGKPAPDFTMNDSTGKAVSLSSFRGKYVLVDFWASWCGPCRRENPNVLSAYDKYQKKNFTVLGVSLDDQKAPWVQAIAKDQLPWTQVSDLKGWKNAATGLYGIKSIPSNFLIAPDGTIIGRNLRGDKLEEALAKAL